MSNEKQPEAGDFTKEARFQLDEGTLPINKTCVADDGNYHIPRDIIEFYHKACVIIDEQAEKLETLSKFKEAIKEWLLQTRHFSVTPQIYEHSSFQEVREQALKLREAKE